MITKLESPPETVQDIVDRQLGKAAELVPLKAGDPIPEGYTLLNSGVTRRIRANRDYSRNGDQYGDKPWRVFAVGDNPRVPPKELLYSEVIPLGPVKFVAKTLTEDRADGCGPQSEGVIYIETEDAILVK